MATAAVVSTVVVGPVVLPRVTLDVLLFGIGFAVLLPVFPFTLEMFSLRRLTTAAFGTLMALEPAFAMVVGFVVLAQVPGPAAWSASSWWSPQVSVLPAAAPGPGTSRGVLSRYAGRMEGVTARLDTP